MSAFDDMTWILRIEQELRRDEDLRRQLIRDRELLRERDMLREHTRMRDLLQAQADRLAPTVEALQHAYEAARRWVEPASEFMRQANESLEHPSWRLDQETFAALEGLRLAWPDMSEIASTGAALEQWLSSTRWTSDQLSWMSSLVTKAGEIRPDLIPRDEVAAIVEELEFAGGGSSAALQSLSLALKPHRLRLLADVIMWVLAVVAYIHANVMNKATTEQLREIQRGQAEIARMLRGANDPPRATFERGLLVRAGPSYKAARLGHADRGVVAEIFTSGDGWAFVEAEELSGVPFAGWVRSHYLRPISESQRDEKE